jgi:hypothetical protein
VSTSAGEKGGDVAEQSLSWPLSATAPSSTSSSRRSREVFPPQNPQKEKACSSVALGLVWLSSARLGLAGDGGRGLTGLGLSGVSSPACTVAHTSGKPPISFLLSIGGLVGPLAFFNPALICSVGW